MSAIFTRGLIGGPLWSDARPGSNEKRANPVALPRHTYVWGSCHRQKTDNRFAERNMNESRTELWVAHGSPAAAVGAPKG